VKEMITIADLVGVKAKDLIGRQYDIYQKQKRILKYFTNW
jgi:hypothetical protein